MEIAEPLLWSFVIVGISSFLNSELKFRGWSNSIIGIYFGITLIFELIRLYFGYLNDRTGHTKNYIIGGFITSLLGIGLIPFILSPKHNILLIPVIGLFFAGSAVATTLIDAHMTRITQNHERNRG